jgi:outer membrane murein-binding lipoprotein Lpp
MAQIKAKTPQNNSEVTELRTRLEELEKKCTAMQEQITDAHMLLADERRALDKKLAESFPEVAAENTARRQEIRQRI